MSVYEILTIVLIAVLAVGNDSGDLSRATELDRGLLRRPVRCMSPPDVLVGEDGAAVLPALPSPGAHASALRPAPPASP